MPLYRHPDATGREDELVVIEDPNMFEPDESGVMRPTYTFIDEQTVRAHPAIVQSLLEGAERLWTMDELLDNLTRP